jgi:cation diffusion facilitator CzcD-associated flavoprotein CzcO
MSSPAPAPDPSLPRVCIIGAGSSGIATCKVLHEAGIPFDCFEASDQVGGNWVFKNKNGMSSAYRSLHINTSRDKMAYSDFPMPRDYPDYPHHADIATYFNSYVDNFGFRDHITFSCAVTWARRIEGGDNDGVWEVTLETGEKRFYDALCVANGHHWDARWPTPRPPGQFTGIEMHSHNYIDPTEPHDLRGKRIVVVGFGNSALDISCELGRKENNDKLYLSMRRGYWVVPRYFGSKVLDFGSLHPSQDPPLKARLLGKLMGKQRTAKIFEKMIAQISGLPQEHGLPEPDHPFGFSHPAISHELYNRIGSGDVIVKPDIQEFEGKTVRFKDGSEIEADAIIWCTGYNITFPFFDQAQLSAPNNDIALWKRMMDPRFDNLFMVALVQPLCAMMPIAEEQSKLIAAYLTGRYSLPDPTAMDRERVAMNDEIKAGYVNSTRHTIQINCGEYAYDLRQELRAGTKRADRTGRKRAIAARAAKAGQGLQVAAE